MYMPFVRFWGLVNYFRKVIDHLALLAEPLTNPTLSKVKWEWTSRYQQSFLALKYYLTNAPLLRFPNEKLPYEVVTDAPFVSLGAVLLQEGQPIYFESRKLNDAEKNYHTIESEEPNCSRACSKNEAMLFGGFYLHSSHLPCLQYILPDSSFPVKTSSKVV
jgi:hypothetical protein